jgi:hypothetical protein
MANLLTGLRLSWVAFGWFIAAALTALVLLALAAAGLIDTAAFAVDESWVGLALALGFGTAGFFVGTRVVAAPMRHGVGIGLFSLVVWLLANLALGEPTDQTAWSVLGLGTVAGLLVLQTAAAVVGARMGVRWARRGRNG